MKKVAVIMFIFLCSFSISYASVEIREVMYNPDGSDTNREWIEVYNNGSSVNIDSWYLNENDVYHGLYPEGFSSLGSGERALIVRDIATAESELGHGIKYIKSSFSLNNTGEILNIANENKSIVNSYTYNSDDGANGDGNSLQLIGSSWIPSAPTPGKENVSHYEDTQQDDSHKDLDGANTTTNVDPYYLPNVELPITILAKTDFNLVAEVTYINGSKKIRKLGGYYYINFGDGNTLESDERINTKYSYKNQGDYVLVFEYYRSKFLFDKGEEPDALIKKNISVINNNIEIKVNSSLSGIELENNTSALVDISSWKIKWKDDEYVFPRYSYIRSNEKIDILSSTLGFSPNPTFSNRVRLLSNAGELISSFPVVSRKRTSSYVGTGDNVKSSFVNSTNNTNNTNNTNHQDSNNKSDDSNFFGESDSYLDEYLKKNPNKMKVDFGENRTMTANVYEARGGQAGNNRSIYYALGSLLLMLGAARFTKHNNKQKISEDSDLGTIEVIE